MPEREEEARAALQAVLPRGALQFVDSTDDDLIAILPDGSRRRLALIWSGHGYPRDVERALGTASAQDALFGDTLVVFVATSFSEGARETLRSRNISWVGLDGSAELRLGTVWVDRDGHGRGHTFSSSTGWTRARADVVEALLAVVVGRRHDRSDDLELPEVEALASLSGRSYGTVANTFAMLDEQQWTAGGSRARARVLRAPSAILDSWSVWEAQQHRRFDGFHSIHREPTAVVRELQQTFGSGLVLTAAAASELVRPTLTGTYVVTAYIEEAPSWTALSALTREVKMLPSATPRVRLAPAPRVIANTSSIVAGARVASPARTYTDLLSGSAREHEAAEIYRRSALGPLG